MKIYQVSPKLKPNELDEAITLLQKGEVIAFPTDTVYGLGVDMANQEAVDKLYEIKGRPEDMPLILLGENKEELVDYVLDWSPVADQLTDNFWPGPLTLILKKSFKVPNFVVSNLDSVGIRVPNHPIILKILNKYGKPIATSSANLSGNSSNCTGRKVQEDLNYTDLSLLLDAGKTISEEASTIVSLTENIPVLLREGSLKAEKLGLENYRNLTNIDD